MRRLGIRVLSFRALGAVLGAALFAVGHADRIQGAAGAVVAHAGKFLHASAPNHHDRVLLKVVTDAGDVRRDFDAIGQANARDFSKSRVRLLRRRRVDARANAALLRRGVERRAGGLDAHPLAPVSYQLRNRRHRLSCHPGPPEPWKGPRSTVNRFYPTGRDPRQGAAGARGKNPRILREPVHLVKARRPETASGGPFRPGPRYSKYPFTSTIRWTVPPEGSAFEKDAPPPVPRRSTALFARVCPAEKLSTLVGGIAPPSGNTVMCPPEEGCVTVRLTATLFAVAGIPHWPVTTKLRTPPPARAGPPYAPEGFRVSTIRQGESVWKAVATGGEGSTRIVGPTIEQSWAIPPGSPSWRAAARTHITMSAPSTLCPFMKLFRFAGQVERLE